MTEPPPAGIRWSGDTNVGKVRTTNEDAMTVDPVRGLYVVLDGMGGANAGDIASKTARDAIHSFVVQRRLAMEPRALLEAAIQAGCGAVYRDSLAHRERHGMGTTVVACLVPDARRAIVGHVGDSRAYLLRAGRLQALTRDHTIVEELVERGMLSAEDAERHPYKNVLSRNLGSKDNTKVDLIEVELKPGDRLLLCSDGLYGYASAEAIQYILGSGDPPDQVTSDLIELALRGGGGDNVTTIVIEAPASPPSSTQVVQTTGAEAWWQRRQRFLMAAKEGGLTRNPIVRGLEPKEALQLVALSLCEAIFHDLEKSTGVNVWTFAQNLAGGWFARGGGWAPLRDMLDILVVCARTVVDEVRASDAQLGFVLDVAVSRALVVAELALGGLLAERLLAVDTELVELQTARHAALEAPSEEPTDAGERFTDRATIPFLRSDRPVTGSSESDEVTTGIENALTIARARTAPRAELVKQVLAALQAIATEHGGDLATSVTAARELYGVRAVDDAGVMPLFDALDHARILTAASVHQIQVSEPVRARVLRAISAAHQRLVGATTGLVLEAAAPFTERLRESMVTTAAMRDQVAKAEKRRAELERKHATNVDPSLPWGSRGTTEW